MPQAQTSQLNAPTIEWPLCPHCRSPMWLTRLRAGQRQEERLFECPICEAVTAGVHRGHDDA